MSDMIYRPLIDDMTWSYSRIESFEDCPYKWYMKYICHMKEVPQFYASYGSYMHRLIELYYRGFLTKDEMLFNFVTDFSTEVEGRRPSPEIVQKYIDKGIQYLSSFEPFPYKMIAVEKKVQFKIGDNDFIGYIDYLGEKDGKLYIIDNKSRDLKPRSKRKKPTMKDAELDQFLRQLYLYAEAIHQEYGQYPESLCFNCFKSGVFIEEPFNMDALNDALRWASETIESIKDTNEFYPRVEFFSCYYICGLSDECEYWNSSR